MKNIEFKTPVLSFRRIVGLLNENGARREGMLRQVDTYFRCPSGRLKLRVIDGRESVLIGYHRPARGRSRTSTYRLMPLSKLESVDLASMLTSALGILTTVRKTRVLWLYERTRIHLDTVAALGRFVELETVVGEPTIARARREHQQVLSILDLENATPITGSYSDLMLDDRRAM